MRAISTVLDVSLCLLLVTASALTLVGTPHATQSNPKAAQSDPDAAQSNPDAAQPDPDTADETIEILTTATARVTYSVGDQNRTIHDTLAGLLTAAALADVAHPEVSVNATTDFRRAVTTTVSRALRRSDAGVQVLADCEECSVSLSTRRITAGEQPPPKADVHAATVSVPGELPTNRVRLTVRTWSR